jgi:uncharacterized Zn finger protein
MRAASARSHPFALDQDRLLALASPRIVRRGLAYARAGRVTDLRQSNGRIEGRVQGSEPEPYLVSLEHDGEEILPSCSCPFDWEPFCKHAVAVLAVSCGLGRGRPTVKDPARSDVEQEEIEVRRKRATREGFRVTQLEGDRFLGVFEVSSPSGKTYRVEIRSLSERVNRCSCCEGVCQYGPCPT